MTTTIIIFALLRTTLFLAVGGLVCRLMLRRIEDRVPRLSRVLWLAVLLSGWFWVRPMISIPCEQIAKETETVAAVPAGMSPQGNMPEMTPARFEPSQTFAPVDLSQTPIVPATTDVVPTEAVSQRTAFDVKPWILPAVFAVWLGGMVVSIFLAAAGYVKYLSALGKTVPASDDFAGPWHRLLEERGIDTRTIPMLVSGDAAGLGPALIRTVRGYRLVVPRELWSELSEAGRCGILRHELAHFLRRDVWKSFFVRVLTLPHWFNPIAHLAAHRFDEAAEQLCDRAAFDLEPEGALEFARTLLLLHENAPTQFVARQSIFGRGLKHRVACLLHENPERKVSLMKKTLIIFSAVTLLAVCLFQIQFVARNTAQATPEPVAEEKTDGLYVWSSVIDAETKKPMPGVTATLYFAKQGGTELDTRVTRTNDKGEIRFPLPSELNADLENSNSEVLLEKEGYVPEKDGRMSKWAEKFLKDGKDVFATVQLQKAESITGRLVNAEGEPLPNVTLACLREKTKPFRREYISPEFFDLTSDAEGRFRIDAAKDERIVFWAIADDLAPKYVFPDKDRGDLGDIVLEKGFRPTVKVIDENGKPVENVWVDIYREREESTLNTISTYRRSALTDQNGESHFRPVADGQYEIRISETPSEKRYNPYPLHGYFCSFLREENKRSVKGQYFITPVELSAKSPEASIQAQKTVKIDVVFTDGLNDDIRENSTDIHGRKGEAYYSTSPSSESPSAYQGDGLFSFQVPVGLENASLRVFSKDDSLSHRCRIAGTDKWLENGGMSFDFQLGAIENDMRIEVFTYKSPRIELDVTDESGKPVEEYYAWIEYVKNEHPARIKLVGDKVRVDITEDRWHEINWDWATSESSLSGILDVSFTYKDFGNGETKINSGGILPGEAMRLYIVTRDYELTEQVIPAMSEGETKHLTVTLKPAK